MRELLDANQHISVTKCYDVAERVGSSLKRLILVWKLSILEPSVVMC